MTGYEDETTTSEATCPSTYSAQLHAAIDILTEAALTSRPGADWPEFVTLALAGAAANAGGIEPALSGRPGSWEAAGVRHLLVSTVGEDEAQLWQHRAPVTLSVLAWAVSEDGRDLESLSGALEVAADTLDAWVLGDASPTSGEVSKLAKILKRPRALFFLPGPPGAATLPASFAIPPGDDRQVSPETRRSVRRARRVQQAVSWVYRDDPVVEMPRTTTAVDPGTAAATARDWVPRSPSSVHCRRQRPGWNSD